MHANMHTDVVRIQEDMDVYGWDGAKMGTVRHVWTDNVLDDADVLGSGYFEVELRDCREKESDHLFVPFSAVTACVPGKRLKLDFSDSAEPITYRVLPRDDEW